MAPKRFNLHFSPAAIRFLGLVFLASLAVPFVGRLIEQRMVPAAAPSALVNYHGSRGPWRGSVAPNGGWAHPDGPTDYDFAQGDSVVWESWSDVAPGTNISAEFSLVCTGRTISTVDFHVYSNERREGWATFGITVPKGTPAGTCGVTRSGDLTGANGQREHRDYPPFPIHVLPAPLLIVPFVPPPEVSMPAAQPPRILASPPGSTHQDPGR